MTAADLAASRRDAGARDDARDGARRDSIRIDLQLIADMVAPGSRVLDVGCGDGMLLDYLVHFKGVDGRGIELSQDGVNACVTQGLSVIQGDADTDLRDYPSDAFDYVVLSQTLQATVNPRGVLHELVRIGRHAIVSFPNFGYWRVRAQLLLSGRMPRTHALLHDWYDTPNIHLCTITDFVDLAAHMQIAIERALTLDRTGTHVRERKGVLANLFGEQAVFLLSGRVPRR
ncbi:MAG TPA: methionine biosynthesis protein MetW [Candidatus Sulfotelmatobacter sp.]|nr:methionine biosynthesis protein MetW [Candidatus Sulfotelmatobacter sp.]